MAVMMEQSRGSNKPARFTLNTPDPFRPANLYRLQTERTENAGKRWINHQERRSRILAATRRLMVDTGVEGICFRDIAERCEISVPTIYNIVGDRSAVLHQAAVEWVQWLSAAAGADEAEGNKVLRLIRYYWRTGPEHFEYTKTAAGAFRTTAPTLLDAFNKTGVVLVSKCLADLRASQHLRSCVSIENLAGQLVLSANAGICNWALSPYALDRYWRDFANGPGLMLLGAVRGPEMAIVEQGLDALIS